MSCKKIEGILTKINRRWFTLWLMAEFMIEVLENSLQQANRIMVSVHWNVLWRIIASRCGSSPKIQGRLHSHLQGFAEGSVEQAISLEEQGSSLFYQVISSTLKMEMESVPEKSKKFHILTRLSAWEHFVELCRRESFKTDKDIVLILTPK